MGLRYEDVLLRVNLLVDAAVNDGVGSRGRNVECRASVHFLHIQLNFLVNAIF